MHQAKATFFRQNTQIGIKKAINSLFLRCDFFTPNAPEFLGLVQYFPIYSKKTDSGAKFLPSIKLCTIKMLKMHQTKMLFFRQNAQTSVKKAK